jgi:C_GCAxxG_C_C family probable redox protein
MPSQSQGTSAPSFACDAETARRFRNRGLANLLRMGHCAPSIMQAMLDVFEIDAQSLVKLMAGMPGGIGNTGGECGGVTAPLVVLGLRHGEEPMVRGLPVVVYKGHHHQRRFADCQGTTACRGILGDARLPLRCVGVIMQAPILCAESCNADCTSAISAAQQEAFRRLYDYWCENEFHCAHAVFHHLQGAIPVTEELLNGSSGFMGGTLFTGMTCSALAAGVMALGLMFGQIENSHLRVLHMIGLMAVRGDAFADDVNAFNKTMNLGNRLAQGFTAEFGSTQCRAITQCDFATPDSVQRYIDDGGAARCSALAQSVALRVLNMIQPADVAESVQGVHAKRT